MQAAFISRNIGYRVIKGMSLLDFKEVIYYLRCLIFYCTALYCTILYCTALYCTVLYCILLYCTALYCTNCLFICTVLKWSRKHFILSCIEMCIAVQYLVFYCISSCFIILYYTILIFLVTQCIMYRHKLMNILFYLSCKVSISTQISIYESN